MKKYYEDEKYNASFSRCIDAMTNMMKRYGQQVLDKMEQDATKENTVNEKGESSLVLKDKSA